MSFIRLRGVFARIITATCLIFSSLVWGADLQLAASWLGSQQEVDGSFFSPIATPVQSTAEVRKALAIVLPVHQAPIDAATEFLVSRTETASEALARVHAVSETRGSLEFWLGRRTGAGWGDFSGFPPTVSSTSFVLQAASQRQWEDRAINDAIVFLELQQSPSGGWRQPPNTESTLLTAYAVEALRPFQFSHSVAHTLELAVDFLLAELTSRGSELETYEKASAVLALAPFLSDVTEVKSAVEQLESGQRANGSWEGDAYTTALVMQALAAVDSLRRNSGSSCDLSVGCSFGTYPEDWRCETHQPSRRPE